MAATDAGHQFNSIFLGQRGGVGQGQLKISPTGFLWRRIGGGLPVEIRKSEIESLHWTRVTRGCQLGVRVKDGITTNFIGFREKDLESLQAYCKQQFDKDVQELRLATTGRNWGAVAQHGKSLMFMVDGRMAFQVPLPDVAQAQQVKDDVVLEFHVDDGAGDEREDALAELVFHVPPTHQQWKVDESEDRAAKSLLESVLPHTDTGAASADTAAATFSDVHILAPRGRFEVEMMLGQLQLTGQAQDFKIRYTAIQRVFILPKSATPHTLVVISLDPPIRKGNTYYTHILAQFPTEEDASIELDISPDALAAKNEKCGGKLEASMAGPVHEVFARALRGLSGAKITRPGTFRNAHGDGYAVRCSCNADDGYLYPLDRAFFYIHKPPMLIPFDDVESVELTRLGGNTVSSKTFDLVVRTKSNQEHQFRYIQRNEWQGLLDFFQAKKLRVSRLKETQAGPAAQEARAALGLDDDDGLRGADDEDDEDEDFDVDKASGSEGSDSDEDESGDAVMVDEEDIQVKPDKSKKSKKRPSSDDSGGDDDEEAPAPKEKTKKSPKKAKASKDTKEEAGGKTKKPRAKKDPNAPKNALSAYMYFSTERREQLKNENPGISFGDLAKLISERWKGLSAEEKAPFEEKAKLDKERYQKAMAAYKASKGGAGPFGSAADGGDDEEDDAEQDD